MLIKEKDSFFDENDIFPWYDGYWLYSYVKSKEFIFNHCPEKLEIFVSAFEIFKTSKKFQTKKLQTLFTTEIQQQMIELIEQIEKNEFEKYEFLDFGRLIKHNLPFFNQLQEKLVSLVSEEVGEEVEVSYNFLSLYNSLGKLDPHMDAAPAKWTLDYCINQSTVWPIYLSKVLDWPENFEFSENWMEDIKTNVNNEFKAHQLKPTEAILFSGMSQWHYRERITTENKNHFCHLVFFHFIPKGSKDLCYPKKWAQLFDIPELNNIVLDL